MKKRTQGLAGMFIRSRNPKETQDWYDKHLGISPLPHSPWGSDDDAPLFEWRDIDNPDRKCYSVFSFFPEDSDYFDDPAAGPTGQQYIIGFRTDDLDALLTQLREEGVTVHDDILEFPFGRFARITDPEGTVVELWEPTEGF